MSGDPLASHKAVFGIIDSLVKAKDDKDKTDAGEGVAGLSEAARDMYDLCIEGAKDRPGADDAPKVCLLAAQDFDRRHPKGLEADVEKTVTTAGFAADVGTPSAEVHLTDGVRTADTRAKRLKKPRRLGKQ